MSSGVISTRPSGNRRPCPQVVPVPGQPLIIRPESGNISISVVREIRSGPPVMCASPLPRPPLNASNLWRTPRRKRVSVLTCEPGCDATTHQDCHTVVRLPRASVRPHRASHRRHRPAAYDTVSIDVFIYRYSYGTPSRRVGAASAGAQARKLVRYQQQARESGYRFKPFGIEVYGAWGPSAISLLNELTEHSLNEHWQK